MRAFMTAVVTLTLGSMPMAAQVPVRPTPPTPPAQQGGQPAPLTAEQRDQQQAIREKYIKVLRAQRDAIQATNAKLRAEIEGVLTPEQRARMARVGGLGMATGDENGLMGLPPQNDIYARPGGMMRGRAEAMMRTRPNWAGQRIIIMMPRRAMRARRGMKNQQTGRGRATRVLRSPLHDPSGAPSACSRR